MAEECKIGTRQAGLAWRLMMRSGNCSAWAPWVIVSFSWGGNKLLREIRVAIGVHFLYVWGTCYVNPIAEIGLVGFW